MRHNEGTMEGLDDSIKRLRQRTNPNLHSEIHLLVEEARALFGETALKGKGSFAFYLGFFKRLGIERVRRLLGEIKESRANDPKKLFWWKVKQELARKNPESSN